MSLVHDFQLKHLKKLWNHKIIGIYMREKRRGVVREAKLSAQFLLQLLFVSQLSAPSLAHEVSWAGYRREEKHTGQTFFKFLQQKKLIIFLKLKFFTLKNWKFWWK